MMSPKWMAHSKSTLLSWYKFWPFAITLLLVKECKSRQIQAKFLLAQIISFWTMWASSLVRPISRVHMLSLEAQAMDGGRLLQKMWTHSKRVLKWGLRCLDSRSSKSPSDSSSPTQPIPMMWFYTRMALLSTWWTNSCSSTCSFLQEGSLALEKETMSLLWMKAHGRCGQGQTHIATTMELELCKDKVCTPLLLYRQLFQVNSSEFTSEALMLCHQLSNLQVTQRAL